MIYHASVEKCQMIYSISVIIFHEKRDTIKTSKNRTFVKAFSFGAFIIECQGEERKNMLSLDKAIPKAYIS